MRDQYRKIASQGQGLSRETFLTLLCARMVQECDPLGGMKTTVLQAIEELERWLGEIPCPSNGTGWTFFTPNNTDGPAVEAFWSALRADGFNGVWRHPETIGWAYQYYLEPRLTVFRSQSAPKTRPGEIAMRTQQFTPKWIADFLVHNTLGRWWTSMHPDSRLAKTMKYRVQPSDSPERTPVRPVRELKVLDPACGTMHLGFSAAALLAEMYKEELRHAGQRGWPAQPSVQLESKIPEAILRNNLFGIDIDPVALELAAIGLALKLNVQGGVRPNLICADTLRNDGKGMAGFGDFPREFDVVLLNPPYLDKRDYNARLKAFMIRTFPKSGRNFYTAFLERCLDFLVPGGRLGAVTPQTFMFIHSFRDFRKLLLERSAVETLVQTGLNTFEDAIVDCAFYVLRRDDRPGENTGTYFQLTEPNSPDKKRLRLEKAIARLRRKPHGTVAHCYRYHQKDFSSLPDGPWVYWIRPKLRRLFQRLPSLGKVAELRQGLATTDNDRFLRFWWEIPKDRVAFGCRNLAEAQASGKRWFPYYKGGGFRKWYGMREYLVNWEDNGRDIKAEITRRYPYLHGSWQWVAKNSDFYFREGITYSYLTSGQFSARYLPPGSIFDVAGSGVFCDDPYSVLGILNSRWCRFALGLINPTVNFQVGDLQRLPVPAGRDPAGLRDLVREAITLAREEETYEETSPDFVAPPSWPNGVDRIEAIHRRLGEIQAQVNDEVYRLYGLGRTDRAMVERQTPPEEPLLPLKPEDLAWRWISYAVGHSLGRYGDPAANGPVLSVDRENGTGLARAVREHLERILGPAETEAVIQQVNPPGDLSSYLVSQFFTRHFRDYRRRPVYWLLRGKSDLVALYYPRIDRTILREVLPAIAEPPAIELDDGIQRNLPAFRKFLADPAWKRLIS